MQVTISTKLYHARSGSVALFGHDYEGRKYLDDEEAFQLFDAVFEHSILPKIKTAQAITPEKARNMLKGDRSKWVSEDLEQREFYVGQELYLAQLEEFEGEPALDQLWRVAKSSSLYHSPESPHSFPAEPNGPSAPPPPAPSHQEAALATPDSPEEESVSCLPTATTTYEAEEDKLTIDLNHLPHREAFYILARERGLELDALILEMADWGTAIHTCCHPFSNSRDNPAHPGNNNRNALN